MRDCFLPKKKPEKRLTSTISKHHVSDTQEKILGVFFYPSTIERLWG